MGFLLFIKKYFFSIVVTILICLYIGTGWLRFFVLHDFYITVESACDPHNQSCFIESCEGQNCTEQHYYKLTQVYAAEALDLCSQSILGCKAIESCQSAFDYTCTNIYCDSTVDVCSSKNDL